MDDLYHRGAVRLQMRDDEHIDDYSLRIGPMYAEFSDVQWQDEVLLLLSSDGGGYVSVRHDTGKGDIRDDLKDVLMGL